MLPTCDVSSNNVKHIRSSRVNYDIVEYLASLVLWALVACVLCATLCFSRSLFPFSVFPHIFSKPSLRGGSGLSSNPLPDSR